MDHVKTVVEIIWLLLKIALLIGAAIGVVSLSGL
jgi:hypothetical protein